MFWLAVAIGVSLAIATAVGSPLIARFNHGTRLEQIAPVWALTFILSALSYQHYALLRRAMMFKKIALIEVGANLFGASGAVAMALAGRAARQLSERRVL